jgi:hypothetical protein
VRSIPKIPAPSKRDYSKRRTPALLARKKEDATPTITSYAKASPAVLAAEDGPLTLGKLSPQLNKVKL